MQDVVVSQKERSEAERSQIERSQTERSQTNPSRTESQMEDEEQRGSQIMRWLRAAQPFVVTLLILTAFRSSIADWNDVPSGSMNPTIIEGDRVWVNKLAYDLKVPFTTWRVPGTLWGAPARGDIVVFFSPKDGTRLIKRVVGIPGDTIELIENRVILNGKPLEYGPLDPSVQRQIIGDPDRHDFATENLAGRPHAIMGTPETFAKRSFNLSELRNQNGLKDGVIGPDQYFVLGDNRDNSADSRYIGLIPRNNIVGRSSRVILSLDYKDNYLPRKDRWFRGMP